MATLKTEKFIVNLIIFFYKIPSYILSIFVNTTLFIMVWFIATFILAAYINLLLVIVSLISDIVQPTLNKWFILSCAALTFIPCLIGLITTEFKKEFKD